MYLPVHVPKMYAYIIHNKSNENIVHFCHLESVIFSIKHKTGKESGRLERTFEYIIHHLAYFCVQVDN